MSGPKIGGRGLGALGFESTAGGSPLAYAAPLALTAAFLSSDSSPIGQGRRNADLVTGSYAAVDPLLLYVFDNVVVPGRRPGDVTPSGRVHDFSPQEAAAIFPQLEQGAAWWRANVLDRITDDRVRPTAEDKLYGPEGLTFANVTRLLRESLFRYNLGASTAAAPAPIAPPIAAPAPIGPEAWPPIEIQPHPWPLPPAPGAATTQIVIPGGFPGGDPMTFNTPEASSFSWPSLIGSIWSEVGPMVNKPKPLPPQPQQQPIIDYLSEVPWWVYLVAGIAVYSLMQDGRRR